MQGQNELFNDNDSSIRVTKANYISTNLCSCEEIFSGYDELRVITYSYGIPFVEQIMKKFSYAEIIVGYDKMIEKEFAEIMANQESNFAFGKVIINQAYVCDYIRGNNYLLDRACDGTFKVFVPQDLRSHQKVYLLKSNDGRYRTVIGSANFSEAAWKNGQLEDFVIFDGNDAYEDFLSQYENLKDLSTDEISIGAFEAKTEQKALEELPVFKKIEAESAIVIKSPAKIEYEENNILKTNNLSQEIFDTLKSVKLKKNEQGFAVVEAKDVKVLFNELKQGKKEKSENKSSCPQLILDYDTKTVTYKNKPFNLSPSLEEIKENADFILKYFESFDSCIEDSEDSAIELKSLKRTYWKILNYMFLSPFLPYFRCFARKYFFEETSYPIYLMITGYSGIGKTTFIQTVQKLMLDDKPQKYFARNLKREHFDGFKLQLIGFPIFVDELDNLRWSKLKEMVKADDFLIEKGLLNHPCFIFASNDITFLDDNIKRRCIYFKTDVRLDEIKTGCQGRKIRYSITKLTNALYCEYIKRMFRYLDGLLAEIQARDPSEGWIPDIYEGSANIIKDIFQDCGFEMPEEFDSFNFEAYKGISEKMENARRILVETYKSNSEIFEVQKGQNALLIDFSCYANDYKNKKNINILARDLPGYFACEQQGQKLRMRLSEFTRLTGIKIKRGFFR